MTSLARERAHAVGEVVERNPTAVDSFDETYAVHPVKSLTGVVLGCRSTGDLPAQASLQAVINRVHTCEDD